jgi:hypothetical protein
MNDIFNNQNFFISNGKVKKKKKFKVRRNLIRAKIADFRSAGYTRREFAKKISVRNGNFCSK